MIDWTHFTPWTSLAVARCLDAEGARAATPLLARHAQGARVDGQAGSRELNEMPAVRPEYASNLSQTVCDMTC